MTQNRTMTDIWTYRDHESWANSDIVGYTVEAIDGEIGSIDQASYDVGRSWMVVDTGPWIFGRKVMLPAGVIRDIDETEEKVYVDRTKEEIKNAPGYDETQVDDEYRGRLGSYYDSTGDPRSNPSNESLM